MWGAKVYSNRHFGMGIYYLKIVTIMVLDTQTLSVKNSSC